MVLFDERPPFEKAWFATSFRVIMAGMGDDTVMLIAEMYKRGYEPDEIIFCDTGSEFEHTYNFIGWLRSWCNERKWSKVVVLRKWDKDGEPLSVIETAEKNNTLPPAAFGSKSCSLRFKVETADKYFHNHPECLKAWGLRKKAFRWILTPEAFCVLSALTLMSRNVPNVGNQNINGCRRFRWLTGISGRENHQRLRKSVCIIPENHPVSAALTLPALN
jgi:hypothetical protein